MMAGDVQFAAHMKVYNELSASLKDIIESSNILLMIMAERSIVEYDLNEYSPRKFAEDANKSAADDLDEMEEKTLEIVKNPAEFHRIMSLGTRKRDHRNNLPVDGMRKLIASHKTRLKNLYVGRNKEAEPQLNYLDQRYACAQAMEKAYMEEQRQAFEEEEFDNDTEEGEEA